MFPRHNSNRAFTIIELLVVIAIIVVVAGLVVGLNNVASGNKRISRTQVERDRLVTLIESYKSQLGVYPPDNNNRPSTNTLFYELAGGIRDSQNPGNPKYTTRFTTLNPVSSNVLFSEFGINGIVNARDAGAGGDTTQYKLILKDIRPEQTNSLAANTISFVVPVDGPNGRPNPWNYLVGDHAFHNRESFDLWVDIIVRGKTNRIGNWKD